MTTIVYPAVLEGNQATGYKARFPDFPDRSVTTGDMGGLLTAARESLHAALGALADEGEAWPAASPIEQVRAQAGSGPVVLVDLEVDDTPARVNISIGERLLKRIDAAAQARGMTRSGFIASAARSAMGEATGKGEARGFADFETATRRLQEELAGLGRKLTDSLGPDSAFSRNVAELDHRVYDRIQKAADSVSAAMDRRKQSAEAAADARRQRQQATEAAGVNTPV